MAIYIKYLEHKFVERPPDEALYQSLRKISDEDFSTLTAKIKQDAWWASAKKGPYWMFAVGGTLILASFIGAQILDGIYPPSTRNPVPDWVSMGPLLVGIVFIIAGLGACSGEQSSYYYAAKQYVSYLKKIRGYASTSPDFGTCLIKYLNQKKEN